MMLDARSKRSGMSAFKAPALRRSRCSVLSVLFAVVCSVLIVRGLLITRSQQGGRWGLPIHAGTSASTPQNVPRSLEASGERLTRQQPAQKEPLQQAPVQPESVQQEPPTQSKPAILLSDATDNAKGRLDEVEGRADEQGLGAQAARDSGVASETPQAKYHVVITSSSSINDAWQVLSNYESYKRVRAEEPGGPMGGYTRLLHAKEEDDLMELVPTVRVDPLNDDTSFPPLHRATAIKQWLESTTIEEDYVLLMEPDQFFFRQVPMIASPTNVAVTPIDFIDCSLPEMQPVCTKEAYNPRGVDVSQIIKAGDAPVLIHKDALAKLLPVWEKIQREMYNDPDCSHMYWTRTRFAFCLAAAAVSDTLQFSYHAEFMIAPPYHKNMLVDLCTTSMPQPEDCRRQKESGSHGTVSPIIHFTLVQHANQGKWEWDKRTDTNYFPAVPIQYPEHDVTESTGVLMQHLNHVGLNSSYWLAHMAPPPPPSPPPPPLPPSLEKRRQERQKLLEEAATLSAEATAAMRAQMLDIEIEPKVGPVKVVNLPDPSGKPTLPGKYHVVIDVDNRLMGRWQALANHYAYQKVKKANPDGPMGGYTRLLQAREPDNIMHIVPTVLVDPLPAEFHRGYAFVQRPWAYTQWMLKVHIPEEYILVIDPDHLLLQQIPIEWASPTRMSSWPYWFLTCTNDRNEKVCAQPNINPKGIPVKDIPMVGVSPTLSHKSMLAKILPWYDKIVREIDLDEANTGPAFGYWKEMYAFALGTANMDGGPPEVVFHSEAMVEPPWTSGVPSKEFPHQHIWDTCHGAKPQPAECPEGKSGPHTWRNVSLIHYTVASNFDAQGKEVAKESPDRVYHWDKKDFNDHFPATPIPPPPQMAPQGSWDFLKLISEAGESIPLWKAYLPDEPDASPWDWPKDAAQ